MKYKIHTLTSIVISAFLTFLFIGTILPENTIKDNRNKITVKEKYKDHYTKNLFEEADTNHDGCITWQEARAASHSFERGFRNKKRFLHADLNNDGCISLREAQKYRHQEEKHHNRELRIYKKKHRKPSKSLQEQHL